MGSVIPNFDPATWAWITWILITAGMLATGWWVKSMVKRVDVLDEKVDGLAMLIAEIKTMVSAHARLTDTVSKHERQLAGIQAGHITRNEFTAGLQSIRDNISDKNKLLYEKIDTETNTITTRIDNLIEMMGRRS